MSLKGTPNLQKLNFVGIDKVSAPEMMLDGACDDCLDVYSDPIGGLATRPGMARLNTTTVSATAVVTGGWQFRLGGQNYDVFMTNAGKIQQLISSTVYDMTTGLASTDSNIHWSCMNARDSAGALIMIMVHSALLPRKWDGAGGTLATTAALGGTMVTADFCIEWQRYYWLHSPGTNDVYYPTLIDNAESGYTSYLRYDSPDTSDIVTGLGKNGDDMIAFKKWSLTRTVFQPESGVSKFAKFIIEGGIGTVSHWSIQTLPTGQTVWLAPDNNIYILSGNVMRSIGDMIQPFLKLCNQGRLLYAASGINRNKGHYWLSVTYGSSSSTHNKVLVMDYMHPYLDSTGRAQYPWWVFSRTVHSLWEAYVSGNERLYSGGYDGFINREDTGTSDAGTAIPSNGFWLSKIFSEGDPSLDKKYRTLGISIEYKGAYSMYCEMIADRNQANSLVKEIPLNRGASAIALWDTAKWDEDSWSADTLADSSVHIDRTAKLMQFKFYGTTTASQPWRIYNFTKVFVPLKRTYRS